MSIREIAKIIIKLIK